MALHDELQETPISEGLESTEPDQLERTFNDEGLSKGKAIMGRTNPVIARRSRIRRLRSSAETLEAEEHDDRLERPAPNECIDFRLHSERMDALRQKAASRNHVFAFDRLATADTLGPLEQDVLWVLLAAYATGDIEVPRRALIAGIADRPTQELELSSILEDGSRLFRSRLVEHDGEDLRDRRYSASRALLEVVLGSHQADRNRGNQDHAEVDSESSTSCATYHEYLELVLSSAETLLQGRSVEPDEVEMYGEIHALRSVVRRRPERRTYQREHQSARELEMKVSSERSSGRWNDSPLGRIATKHELSQTEERVLVFLALRGTPLDEDGEEHSAIPFQRRRSPGVSGSVLSNLLAPERSRQWEARELLYAEAPLRSSGLVQARSGRQDAPQTMFFGVSETTVRKILGHFDLDEEPDSRPPRTRPREGVLRLADPTVTLHDVVLPGRARESLETALVAFVQDGGPAFGPESKMRENGGLTLALTGPSGTGKTLTAEAIAGELGMVLMKAHVPSLMSKWVGETQKNIAKAFQQAARHEGGAVLFFDEADSLFFDREGAFNSWEVQDVNVLLTEIEQHEGVVVLATNRREALDRALSRRVCLTVELPRPGAAERAEIWRLHLPEKEHLPDDIDTASLAREVDLTGGEIRNAVLEATRRARFRGVDHLDQTTLMEAARSVRAARWGDESTSPIGF